MTNAIGYWISWPGLLPVTTRGTSAKPVVSAVMTLRRKVLGAEHPQTLRAMTDLAQSYAEADRLDEAATLTEQAVSLSRQSLGDEHQ